MKQGSIDKLEELAVDALVDLVNVAGTKRQGIACVRAIFESERGQQALRRLERKLGLVLIPKEML